jgi:hypothetical protein
MRLGIFQGVRQSLFRPAMSCLEDPSGHLQHFFYSEGHNSETMLRKAYVLCYFFLLLWCRFTFCRLGQAFFVYLLGPVHMSVISSVELAAVTHVTIPHSFTCVREFTSVWVQRRCHCRAGGICGDHVNVRHRNDDGDKCVWGQYTWVFPTANTMPLRARPRKWLTCEPGLILCVRNAQKTNWYQLVLYSRMAHKVKCKWHKVKFINTSMSY